MINRYQELRSMATQILYELMRSSPLREPNIMITDIAIHIAREMQLRLDNECEHDFGVDLYRCLNCGKVKDGNA